jgi:hypothetical protein
MLGNAAHVLLGTWMAVAPRVARPANHAVVRLISGPSVADSSHDRWLGLEFQLTPGWHVYWRIPAMQGVHQPRRGRFRPRGRSARSSGLVPRRIEVPPLTAFGYEERVVFPIRFSSRGGDRGIIRGHVSWVACRLECVAGGRFRHAGSYTSGTDLRPGRAGRRRCGRQTSDDDARRGGRCVESPSERRSSSRCTHRLATTFACLISFRLIPASSNIRRASRPRSNAVGSR